MGSRDKEHEQWNLDHGLKVGEHLALFCPRCARPHNETLTNDPKEPDYCHHVHQCTYCGLRFELYVRTRSTNEYPLSAIEQLVSEHHRNLSASKAAMAEGRRPLPTELIKTPLEDMSDLLYPKKTEETS